MIIKSLLGKTNGRKKTLHALIEKLKKIMYFLMYF